MDTSPVILFTYKRLDTLKRTVQALQSNYLASVTELFIFSDAAKHETDNIVVEQVRSYLKTIDGFKQVHIFQSEKNMGLANSIIHGVSTVVNQFGRAIVLEDDLVTTANFLNYMNTSLSFYESDQRVFSVSGYNYDFKPKANEKYDNYFVTRGCSWGWATWADRWNKVNWDMSTYSDINSAAFKKSFNFSGSDLHAMLHRQSIGEVDSWAIRWYYNQWSLKSLTAYPKASLIDNNGFDADATHTSVFNRYKTFLSDPSKTEFVLNPDSRIDEYYQKKIQNKFSIVTRIFWGRGMTLLKNLGLVS